MTPMRSRRLATWLLSLPLMIAGTQLAHVLAYRLVYPDAHVRLSRLLLTGHAYMVGSLGYLPLVLAVVGALDLLAVGWVFAGSVRRSLQRPVPPLAFALLPPLCFTLQELIERWLCGSSFPWWVVLQPTFRIGLLLQLPFALLAFMGARLLLRAAETAASKIRGTVPRPALHLALLDWVVSAVARCAGEPPIGGHSGRGPPPRPAAVACRAASARDPRTSSRSRSPAHTTRARR